MAIKHIQTHHPKFLTAAILVSGFFLGMSTALVTYINSSFLETFVSARWVGAVFSIAYVGSLLAIQNYGRGIAKFGNSWLLYANILLQMLAYLTLAKAHAPAVLIVAFITFILTTTTTILNYDVYLKELAPVNKTGRLRGMFWTVVNLGFLVSPMITGALVELGGYRVVYFTSAIVLIPALLLMYAAFNGDRYRIPYRPHEPLAITLRRAWANRNMRGILAIAFALYFFYAWMVIYTPIYLLQAGFDWVDIGKMFTVMLLPFVLVEYPAGYIADKYIGETELLMIGFGIMAISLFALLTVSSFAGVMIVLLCSRIGASLVEIMRETYFYKKVRSGDLDMMETFRNMNPVAHIIAPATATVMLAFGAHVPTLFLILGLGMAFAAAIPSTMKDSR